MFMCCNHISGKGKRAVQDRSGGIGSVMSSGRLIRLVHFAFIVHRHKIIQHVKPCQVKDRSTPSFTYGGRVLGPWMHYGAYSVLNSISQNRMVNSSATKAIENNPPPHKPAPLPQTIRQTRIPRHRMALRLHIAAPARPRIQISMGSGRRPGLKTNAPKEQNNIESNPGVQRSRLVPAPFEGHALALQP